MQEAKVGDAVVYYNPVGRSHNAVITAVWSPTLVNVVYVSSDETRTDTYGRQIERATSLSHKSKTPVHGMYWAFPEEEPNPIVQPTQT
jgi:hypothetical protein